jgi:V/A-type H+-transporting ATPase subunit E
MSEADQIAGLERALVERANKLAEEYRASARQQHDRLVEEANKRLREDEERQLAAARALGERAYQQRVQAAELELGAELDRLRLELVTRVLARLPQRLAELAADERHYLPLLKSWLREGAAAIESDELVAQLSARDLARLKKDWDKIAKESAPGKRLALGASVACSGGVLIESKQRDIRIDNSFEGRQERMSEALQNAIAEQLVPPSVMGGE